MKKNICVAVLVLAFSSSSVLGIDAMGSAFGTATTAKTVGAETGRFGMVAGIADAKTFAGTFTYGMSQYLDGRLKLGLISDHDETEITFGADIKYQLWSMRDASPKPFDMAFGGMFEFFKDRKYNVFQIGGFVLGSYPVQLSNKSYLTPYAKINMRLEGFQDDGGDSKSELEFGLNGGVSFDLSDNISAFGEFQFDGNNGIFFGMDFRVM